MEVRTGKSTASPAAAPAWCIPASSTQLRGRIYRIFCGCSILKPEIAPWVADWLRSVWGLLEPAPHNPDRDLGLLTPSEVACSFPFLRTSVQPCIIRFPELYYSFCDVRFFHATWLSPCFVAPTRFSGTECSMTLSPTSVDQSRNFQLIDFSRFSRPFSHFLRRGSGDLPRGDQRSTDACRCFQALGSFYVGQVW